MAREIFISYSRRDLNKVTAIKSEIEQATGAECWMDLHDIQADEEDYLNRIAEGIEKCRVFLFMLSKSSQESEHAIGELVAAKNQEKKRGLHVVIVNIDGCEMNTSFTIRFATQNIISWSDLPQKENLIRTLKSRIVNKELFHDGAMNRKVKLWLGFEEDEAKQKAKIEAQRKVVEEAKRKAAEEAKRKVAEEAMRKAAEEAIRKAEEEARWKKAEEERRRRAEIMRDISEKQKQQHCDEEKDLSFFSLPILYAMLLLSLIYGGVCWYLWGIGVGIKTCIYIFISFLSLHVPAFFLTSSHNEFWEVKGRHTNLFIMISLCVIFIITSIWGIKMGELYLYSHWFFGVISFVLTIFISYFTLNNVENPVWSLIFFLCINLIPNVLLLVTNVLLYDLGQWSDALIVVTVWTTSIIISLKKADE